MAQANAQYELSIINILLTKKSPDLLVRLTPDYFGVKDIGNLFRLIKGFYVDHGRFLGFDAVKAELEARITDRDKLKFMCGLIDDIRDKDVSGLTESYLMDELKKQLQFRVALAGVGKIVDAVEKKEAGRVVGEMQSLYERMFSESASESIASADMAAMTGKKIEFTYEKTGLSGIDKYGGLIEAGLSMVLGESGRGKTHMATQWAVNHHRNYEGSSAIMSWEQGAGELRARILSHLSEVDLGKVTVGNFTEAELLKIRLAEVEHLCGKNEEALEFCRRTYKLNDQDFWENMWTTFDPQKKKFMLIDSAPDWDNLFILMEMLVQTRDVRFFVIDYPEIIGRGRVSSEVSSWEYKLAQIGKLKEFCRRHKVRIVFPAQFSEKADHIRYNSGAINYCDLSIAITETEEDKELDTFTLKFKKFRNFLTGPTGEIPKDFRVMKQLNIAKFSSFEF